MKIPVKIIALFLCVCCFILMVHYAPETNVDTWLMSLTVVLALSGLFFGIYAIFTDNNDY